MPVPRSGQRFDYHRKRGVVHSDIMTPENAPEWMHNREALWNAVERQENRSNSQLARDIMVALPHELDEAQRLELVRGFIREQFVDAGMVADFSIHEPSARGDDRNHHAHIMLTMRPIDGDGFSKKKAREWNNTELMEKWREAWADHCNDAFDRAGLEGVSVSHLSLEAQGIDREPGVHAGKDATNAERRGKDSARAERAREIDERNRKIDALTAELAELDAQIAREQQARVFGEGFAAFEPQATDLDPRDLDTSVPDQDDHVPEDGRSPQPEANSAFQAAAERYAAIVADALRSQQQSAQPWTASDFDPSPSPAPATTEGRDDRTWWERAEEYAAAWTHQLNERGQVVWRDGFTWYERAMQVLGTVRDQTADWVSGRWKTFVDFLRDDRDNPKGGPDMDR